MQSRDPIVLGIDPIVLGIESSCDETAAAIVRPTADGTADILGEALLSQDEHAIYGGVVPEIAARAHIKHLDGLVGETMKRAGIGFGDLDAVAATAGPGLIGGVIVGLMTAKGIARAASLPLYAVNHLEGHALSPRMAVPMAFPYLLLLVSGGHCQILTVSGPGKYRRLGTTIDDAAGEAFDKTAKRLGLGYPGGPAVEHAAKSGDPARFPLPRPLTDRPGCDFSFSGLKTAVRRVRETSGAWDDQACADLCAGFQFAIGDCLENRLQNALAMTEPVETLVVAGGVAANGYLRGRLDDFAGRNSLTFTAPPMKLCTDNGAMIAWAGIERIWAGLPGDALSVVPRARWPLDGSAPPAPDAGVSARRDHGKLVP